MKLCKQKTTCAPPWVWALVLLLCAAVIFAMLSVFVIKPLNYAITVNKQEETFPTFKEGELTPRQQKLVQQLKTQWEQKKPGTFYAQGAVEPWCADFVSWNMRELGVPYKNPHTGAWRIPGVYTLKEYFMSAGTWRASGNYTPKTGDVVIYGKQSIHGEHTNIVLKYEKGELTTVGGNEAGAIHVQTWPLNDKLGILGYGVFAQ